MGNVIGRGKHTLFPQTQTFEYGHRLENDGPSKFKSIEKELRNMKLNLVKKIASTRGVGRVSTEPRITISDVGQVRINKLAKEALGAFAYLAWSTEGTEQAIVAFPSLPKGFSEEDMIRPTLKDKTGNPVDQYYWSFGANLTEYGYDFKASGNQSFAGVATTISVGKTVLKAVTFQLPKGALPKHESKPRKQRVSNIGANKPNGAVAPTPESTQEDNDTLQELEL